MTNPVYDHNRLFNVNAEGNKDISLMLSVFGGSLSFSIFVKGEGRPHKLSLSSGGAMALFKRILKQAINGSPNCKETMIFNSWDAVSKKANQTGSLTVGRDDRNMIYIGVTMPALTATKFVIKTGLGVDLSTPLSDIDKSVLAAEELVMKLETIVPTAMAITSFKREGGFTNNKAGGQTYSNAGKPPAVQDEITF